MQRPFLRLYLVAGPEIDELLGGVLDRGEEKAARITCENIVDDALRFRRRSVKMTERGERAVGKPKPLLGGLRKLVFIDSEIVSGLRTGIG